MLTLVHIFADFLKSILPQRASLSHVLGHIYLSIADCENLGMYVVSGVAPQGDKGGSRPYHFQKKKNEK